CEAAAGRRGRDGAGAEGGTGHGAGRAAGEVLGLPALRRRHDTLLFTCAYPVNQGALDQAHAELRQLAAEVRGLAATPRSATLQNSGIAGTSIVAAFSLAITRWL